MTAVRWERSGSPSGLHREIITVSPQTGGQDRPPILFLHGICSGAWAYAEDWLDRAAARGYTASALSFRGHGDSSGYERLRVTTLGDYVADTFQAITTLHAPPVIVAHSMGALVARDVISRYPAAGCVLIAPAPAHGAWRAGLKQLRHSPLELAKSVITARTPDDPGLLFHGLPDARARAAIARMGPESPLVMTSLLRPRRYDPPRCEVAVFGAEFDQMIDQRDVEHTARELGVQADWLPDVGHEVMLDEAAQEAGSVMLDHIVAHHPAGGPRLSGHG